MDIGGRVMQEQLPSGCRGCGSFAGDKEVTRQEAKPMLKNSSS